MEHEILDSISRADIAFRVRGSTPEKLFAAGARALLAIMLHDPVSIRPSIPVTFICESGEIDLLYYEFLSELIYYKDAEKLLLVPERVSLSSASGKYILTCSMRGDRIDRERHVFTVDIKAVTLHSLCVEQTGGTWSATAVVDV